MIDGIDTAVIVGASRGIGLALTERLLAFPSITSIAATYRDERTADGLFTLKDPRLHRLPADVTDEAGLEACAAEIRRLGMRPRLVIHGAGILHENGVAPEKALRQCDTDALERVFRVNSIGPLLTAKHLLPLVPRRQATHFAALSAMVGSIGDNRLGGWYGYRASKAALNQFLKTLSIECMRTHPGLCVTAIHPGTTDTALSKPFQDNVRPGGLYRPDQSARRILDVVLAGTPEDTGRFVNWDGTPIPW